MLIVLLINTLLCLMGLPPAFGIQLATVMAGANAGDSGLDRFVGWAGYFFPAAPIVSVLGSWSAYFFNLKELALVFVAFPWVYLLVLGISLGLFFWRGNRQS